jgi:AraC-like DNA-binding protein
VKLLDASFESCGDLQELFQPLSPDLVALQLSRGPLQGRLRIFQTGSIRFNLLETKQSLFLSGTRRPKLCTVAIPLDKTEASSAYRAQGIPVLWPALMGYNRHLTDFDLKLPARTQLATIVIDQDTLLNQLKGRGGGELSLERWESTNQLELQPELQQTLRDQLRELMERGEQRCEPQEPNQLINTVIQCFEQPRSRTSFIAKREARHQAAIDLLHWRTKHTMKRVTMEELSSALFHSRTSLAKGCQEHFGLTPTQLQRSIRLDRVRMKLIRGSDSIRAIAKEFGFQSRSHFAQRYQDQFGEPPQTTLQSARFNSVLANRVQMGPQELALQKRTS